MRLATSIFFAAALHGALFGVAAGVLSRPSSTRPASVAVEIEVIMPKPDPIREVTAPKPDPVRDSARRPEMAAPIGAPRPRRKPETRPERQRPPREDLAMVRDPTAVDAPTLTAETLAAPHEPSAAVQAAPAAAASRDSRRGVAAPSAGAIVSATPRYRSNPTSEYPIPSKRRREEGIVYLNVVVQVDGLPAAVSLNRSSGHPLLDRAALDSVRHWTFEPARAAGVPVSSLVVIPIRFFLSEQP